MFVLFQYIGRKLAGTDEKPVTGTALHLKPNEFKPIPTNEPLDEKDIETQLDQPEEKASSDRPNGKVEPNVYVTINEVDPKASPRTRQGKDTTQSLEKDPSSGPSLESSGSAESVDETSASSSSASANEANIKEPLDNEKPQMNGDVYMNGDANELDKLNANDENDTSALTNGNAPGDSTLDASESDALLNKSKNDAMYNDLKKANGPDDLSDKQINKKNALLNNIDV